MERVNSDEQPLLIFQFDFVGCTAVDLEITPLSWDF